MKTIATQKLALVKTSSTRAASSNKSSTTSKSFIEKFASLSRKEQAQLLDELKNKYSASKDLTEHKHFSKKCMFCPSVKVYKHGKQVNGGQRYRCQECNKSFNVLTGTSIHHIHKTELWDRFIGLMLDSKSIRYIAKELKISNQTAFDWRHKVLSSFDKIFVKKFSGSVEIDPIYFRFNQKGRKRDLVNVGKIKQGISDQQANVLFTMDRNKNFDFKVVKFGKLSVEDIQRSVLSQSKFKKVKTVYSDSEESLRIFFEEMGKEHKRFVASKGHGKGQLHVNTLNNTKKRLNGWIDYNFNSVSTKYLKNYLNWFLVLEIMKKKGNAVEKFWEYILLSNKAHRRHGVIEKTYQKFLKDTGRG